MSRDPVGASASSIDAPRVLPPGFGSARGAPRASAPPKREVWAPPPKSENNASQPPSAQGATIDLTLEDDDDEPILIESRTAKRESTVAQVSDRTATATEATESHAAGTRPWVCLGMIFPTVLCMYGLPPELQAKSGNDARGKNHVPGAFPGEEQGSALSGSAAADSDAKGGSPAWGAMQFWNEPGFWPVTIYEDGAGAKRVAAGNSFSAPKRNGLLVSTLAPSKDMLPERKAGKPELLNQYGTLAAKFSSVLEHFISRKMLVCVSRGRVLSPLPASAFQQGIETLAFVPEMHVHTVTAAFTHARILLDSPPSYHAEDFPGKPRLLDTHELQASARRSMGSTQSLGPYSDASLMAGRSCTSYGSIATSKGMLEEQQKAQISAVYENLRGSDDLAETEPGPRIVTPLYAHQRQAITFLLERERERSFEEIIGQKDEHISLWQVTEAVRGRPKYFRNIVTQLSGARRPRVCRGAILADDMGLGKTITVISTIAHTMEEAYTHGKKPISSASDSDSDEPQASNGTVNKRTAERARREELRARSRATLLVCPLSIISNWESQIQEHWDPQSRPSIYIYHGNGRLTDPQKLADYDLVITTYSTLGFEFANQSTWTAAAGRDDDGSDDDDDELYEVDATGAALDQVAHKRRERKRRKVESPNTCQRVEWFRIVLDEAHIVKEAKTWQSKAVCNLSGTRRICLTGTPVQNRLDDLYALVNFLRLDPFTDRLTWNRFCGDKQHAYLNMSRGKSDQPLDSASLARVQTIMKFLALRRMKTDKRANGELILDLPPKISRIMRLTWADEERAKYEHLHSRFREEFEGHVADGTVGVNYATILHEILILRMMCDHAELVDDSKDTKRTRFVMSDLSRAISEDGITRLRAAEFFTLLDESLMASCNSCGRELFAPGRNMSRADDESSAMQLRQDENDAPVVTRCQHTFCAACFQRQVGCNWPKPPSSAKKGCPCCATMLRLAVDAVQLNEDDMKRHASRPTESSPVFKDMMSELDTNAGQGGAKQIASAFDPEQLPNSWSTKVRALVLDLLPFSRCNPFSALYDPSAPVLDHVVVFDESKAIEEPGSDQRDPASDNADNADSANNAHQPTVEVRSYPPRDYTPNGGPADHVRPIKSVIFSQWTRMLDKISAAFQAAGIVHVRLDGSMSRTQRQTSLDAFSKDPSIEVLLISLRAGGFGLNLVSACRAYLMDPYWNPAVENQGLDRVHRLGQQRPVITTKFIMSQSIEEQMLALQKRKMELANRVGSRRLSGGDAKEQRNEELKLLFS